MSGSIKRVVAFIPHDRSNGDGVVKAGVQLLVAVLQLLPAVERRRHGPGLRGEHLGRAVRVRGAEADLVPGHAGQRQPAGGQQPRRPRHGGRRHAGQGVRGRQLQQHAVLGGGGEGEAGLGPDLGPVARLRTRGLGGGGREAGRAPHLLAGLQGAEVLPVLAAVLPAQDSGGQHEAGAGHLWKATEAVSRGSEARLRCTEQQPTPVAVSLRLDSSNGVVNEVYNIIISRYLHYEMFI